MSRSLAYEAEFLDNVESEAQRRYGVDVAGFQAGVAKSLLARVGGLVYQVFDQAL